ncbi:tyrosine-type recombinase/integrase [Kordiimonas lipolytica]|uniref:Tyrosine-type recombinase/integrase n=1 Tax=Kordiimonas lipolytica TaxID=1662421 RepID=A0ABV8U716_9PROT|nr:site-specific integrase [Kordiimonas lipolytica]
MASVNTKNGKLFIDFRYKGIRCKEYTRLPDKPQNRKRLTEIAARIEAEILLGTFEYARYFPNSNQVEKLRIIENRTACARSSMPTFEEFAEVWFLEKQPEWRNSYITNIRQTMDKYLLPTFGAKPLDTITKADILSFRSDLVRQDGLKGRKLSPSRINHILTPVRQILTEASDRYSFQTPYRNIKPIKVPRSDVEPFTLQEVKLILDHIREDFRAYYTVRFFAGLRTAEIDGLPWDSVDLERRQILVKQAIVNGEVVPTKTDGSYRTVDMSGPVYQAMAEQQKATKGQAYVFCNGAGQPLRHNDVTKKIWYPILNLLGLKKRRPYQTRHTAATLWLAAGENPEWIARQMGHSNTKMLFEVYSRYVPNLTRKDGSAFERLLKAELNHPLATTDKE